MSEFVSSDSKLYKSVLLLSLLKEGYIFHYEGRYWLLSSDFRLGCAAVDPKTGEMIPANEKGEITVIFALDDSLQSFIQWADSVQTEELLSLSASKALTDINRNKSFLFGEERKIE